MKEKKPKPNNFVKLGTQDERLWMEVQKEAESLIEGYEKALKIQKGMLEYAKLRVKQEQEKAKRK